MKCFADLHLQLDLNREDQIEKLTLEAAQLGFCTVGFTFARTVCKDTVESIRKICNRQKLDFVTRTDLNPKSSKDLIRSLRQCRRKFEVVSVNCFTKDVARQAAKDQRVDLLNFPSFNRHKRFFDASEARLASQNVAAYEINMILLLSSTGVRRVKLLASLRKEVEMAKRFGIPIVVSSGASSLYQMRSPNELVSLSALFGIDARTGLQAVSDAPLAIIGRNRKKLQLGYVAKGIRVVRSGNCSA